MSSPNRAGTALEMNLRKHTILFAQEVACLQRPALTAAWAASLHMMWYYLSFSKASFVTTCCTLGFVGVAVDYAIQWYHRRSQHVRELLPPLLPSTLNREQGRHAPSAIVALDSPRTYAELLELQHQCFGTLAAVKDSLMLWRSEHADLFSGCMAAGCFVLGVLFNRASGPFLLYIFVLVILLLPILERSAPVRHVVVLAQPARVSSFLATHSVPPLPSHEEEVQLLAARLPDVNAVLDTHVSPATVRHRAEEDLVKEDLKQYFKDQDDIEAIERRRRQRSAALLGNLPNPTITAVDPAVAELTTSGLRRRNTNVGAGAAADDDDGFSLIDRSDAD